MKCRSCGSPLTLEQKFCPHCGSANVQAAQHAQDMERYQDEFEYTKSDVYHKARSFASNAVKGVVVSVLFIAILVLIFSATHYYDVEYRLKELKNRWNRNENVEQIEDFLEDNNYYAIGAYCNAKNIYAYDDGYEEYRPIINMATQYYWFYDYFLDVTLPNRYTYDGDYEWMYSSLSSGLNQFYMYYLEDYESMYNRGNLDMVKMQPYMDDMVNEVSLVLTEYLGLTEDEALALPYMRDAQRTLMIEEKLENARE